MPGKNAPDHTYQRAANLRQRLLRASRIINMAIVEQLHEQGFTQLRSTHTALLSHLDLDGNTLTEIARRAGMTKQAMGRLADELVKLNYISRSRSETDRRAVHIKFTRSGLKLMQKSFKIMQDMEIRCSARLGSKPYKQLLMALDEITEEFSE